MLPRKCRQIAILSAILSLIAIASPCKAATLPVGAERQHVFAGFAFAGDYAHRQSLYPYSADIAENDSQGMFDTLLREKLLKKPVAASRLSVEKADSRTDVTCIAFALTQESVEIQRIDNKYWVIVVLQANVLAFNKLSSSVVASYPVRMRFTRVHDTYPAPKDIKLIVREAYTARNTSENIFDQWLNKLETVKIKTGAVKYLRVTDILIKTEAEAVLKKAGISISAYKNQVANLVEAGISEKAGISIVPNTVGEAIGGKMMLRFSNAEVLNLNLPDADYAISFIVRDFVTKSVENNEDFHDIYRVKAGINIKQPDTGRTYIDENIYDTHYVVRPKQANVQLNDWSQYFKLLQQLISGLGKELVRCNDDWLKEHASKGLEARPEFHKSNKLLQEMI